MNKIALIIDDEPDIRGLVAMTLERIGLDTHTAANLAEARHLLETYDFDVCLTDMRLPDGNGAEFVREIQAKHPLLPVAVITAHGNMEAAVLAMKNGAFDFVSKPVDIKQLRSLVMQAVAVNEISQDASTNSASLTSEKKLPFNAQPELFPLADEIPRQHNASFHKRSIMNQEASAHNLEASGLAALTGRTGKRVESTPDAPVELSGAERLVGNSAPMQTLRKMIQKVARTNAPVWITGESGTGKELIARLIHDNGPRHDHPFVAINCGAIPSELMESELFGHCKGSFTGAVSDKEGLFRSAEGGTLFLDEVAELPLNMQVKLLRAIQERSIRPVGGESEIAINARVLSASHADLAEEVEAGRFRHDLYYRLNVISIRSPSLRDRSEDIDDIARAILQRIQHSDTNGSTMTLAPSALGALSQYHFPGNVRELENILERAIAMADGHSIERDDLALQNPRSSNTAASPSLVAAGRSSLEVPNHRAQSKERERIREVLDQTRWNRKLAAEQLGLTYRQLRYRIQQLGVDQGD